jgi:hypothetical protein
MSYPSFPPCERNYQTAESEFMFAMHEYKKTSGRMFPTWCEVLEVLHGLGWPAYSNASVRAQEGLGDSTVDGISGGDNRVMTPKTAVGRALPSRSNALLA